MRPSAGCRRRTCRAVVQHGLERKGKARGHCAVGVRFASRRFGHSGHCRLAKDRFRMCGRERRGISGCGGRAPRLRVASIASRRRKRVSATILRPRSGPPPAAMMRAMTATPPWPDCSSSAFLSSTLLPGSSEVVLGAIVAQEPMRLWPAIAVATRRQHARRSHVVRDRPLAASPAHADARGRDRASATASRRCCSRGFRSSAMRCASRRGGCGRTCSIATLAMAAGKFARYVVLAFVVQQVAA